MFSNLTPQVSTIMDSLICGWLSKFNCLYQPEKKKLCVLALISLLPTNHRFARLLLLFLTLISFAFIMHAASRVVIEVRLQSSICISPEAHFLGHLYSTPSKGCSQQSELGGGRNTLQLLPLLLSARI